MTTERDPNTRTVLSWLREDAHENAERVLLRALDEVETTPQRRSWWPARRISSMNSAYKIAVASAAVLLVAIVGNNLLPRVAGPGQPTLSPTPRPTAAPTASPSPTVAPLPPEGQALPPGRYSLLVPGADVRVALTVEDGWTSGTYFIVGNTKLVSFWTAANVYDDICDPATGGLPTASQLPSPGVGPTVDDLVAAFDAQVNTDMSPPVDVTVGGYTGKRVTMRISDPYDHCIGDDEPRPMWVDAAGEPKRGLQPGEPDTIWVVDVAGRRVVIVAYNAGGPDAKASIDGVIESIEFLLP